MQLTWAQVKTIVDSKSLTVQWIDVGDWYWIHVVDGTFILDCTINKSIEPSLASDFETNYKPYGNININKTSPDGLSQSVSFDHVSNYVINSMSFVSSTGFESISGTSETPILLLKNPSSSGKRVLISHIQVWTDSSVAKSCFSFYSNPTISSDGTSVSSVNTFIKSSPLASVCSVYKLPTISSNGSYLNIVGIPPGSHSRGVNRWYMLDENNNFMVTAKNSVTDCSSIVDVYWLEVDL